MVDFKAEEFVVRLSANCRRRHKHTHFKGKVVSFSVQLEIRLRDTWHPVIRYDTAHGFAHRDFIHPNGEVEKTSLFLQDYNETLIFAEEDLKTNWELYKERFLRPIGSLREEVEND